MSQNSTSAAPPSYEQASAGSATTQARPNDRDIEQESRPLPPGWLPQYDQKHDRFFFVDTNDSQKPRSTWVHPLDDPEWLSSVPAGKDPLKYIDELWQHEPEPTPEPQRRTLPHYQHVQQNNGYMFGQTGPPGAAGPYGVRQGGIQGMQHNYPGTQTMNQGQPRMVTMEDLVQHELSSMGSPEEYARKHPPSKVSKLFHHKESPSKRQRRHAEHRARDLADELSYRAPVYSPYNSPYGYPGYGRGYGAFYPGFGMSGAFLGLGAGALLGAALW